VERLRGVRNFAIVALVALAIALAPGGGTGLAVVLWILTVAFFVAIALLGYRLYRENRLAIESLSVLERTVAYGSVALAFAAFTGTNRLFSLGGGGVLAWFALLGLASYGVFWVWRHASRYG
jgi:RsiW-degrading membrane proteinase PrsW (M82 family)